jgi:hypothetical protein
MACRECSQGRPSSPSFPAGSADAAANTFRVAAGQTQQLTGSQPTRRAVAVTNQSGGTVVVGFGQDALIDGPGAGFQLGAGQTITVNTQASVTVLNPQASSADVGLVVELD